jgi:hypothetical protein
MLTGVSAVALAVSCGGPSSSGGAPTQDANAGVDAGGLPDAPVGEEGSVSSAPEAGLPQDSAVAEASACPVPMPPLSVSVSKRVIPILLEASDAPPSDTAARVTTYGRVLGGIQRWYGEAMGATHQNATFHFESVRVLRSKYTRLQWDDFGENGYLYPNGTRSDPSGTCSMWYAARDELGSGGLLAAAGLPALGTAGVVYLSLATAGKNGACGGDGLAAFEGGLHDNFDVRCPDGRHDGCVRTCATPGTPKCDAYPDNTYDCAAVGAMAHEIGHGFGLPHGQDRIGADQTLCANKTLMDWWWMYDQGGPTLCDPDRRDLAASGYFAAPAP